MRNSNVTRALHFRHPAVRHISMNGIIYLVGLVVVIMAVLSFIGIH
jgi:hypothetical protein